MSNMLIIQFDPQIETDPLGFLIEMEDTLIQAFNQNNVADVDGHDIGYHTMNIFVRPKGSWSPVIERVLAYLLLKNALDKAIIAKRFSKSGKHKVIHPKNYEHEFSID